MMLCNQVCRWNTYADGCTKPFEVNCPLSNMNVGKDTNVPTNADHIRSMTDEELAKCLAVFVQEREDDATYTQTWLDWLKEPYKEGTND